MTATDTPAPPRVTVAEDSVLLREGMCRLLAEAGFTVVAAVGDGEELLRAVGTEQPDVVVADVRMPRPTPTRGCGPRW
jgi:CheY-like chemotaxis protein